MLDEDDFLDVLYQAPADPAQWLVVMERLSDAMGGAGAWLSSISVVDGSGEGLWARTDPRFPQAFFAHFAARNPLNNVPDPDRYMQSWRPRVLTDEDWMPKDALRVSEFYNDFLEPLEATSVAMIRLARHPREAVTSVVNIGRPTRRGQFERGELETAERLHRHLMRAFSLTVALARSRQLDASGGPVRQAALVVDEEGRILQATPQAEGLLREPHGLRAVRGRLSAHEPKTATALAELLRRAGARPPQPRTGGVAALRGAEETAPRMVWVAPLRDAAPGVFIQDRLNLVLVTDPAHRPQPAADTLKQTLGLTPAESRLALGLLDGSSLRETAQLLGISQHTAAVHLAHIFDKTGVRRQSALLALLLQIGQTAADAAARSQEPRV